MFVLTDSQEVVVNVSAVSAAGNPAPIENVEVTSSDDTLLTVINVDDVFKIVTTGKTGVAQIVVKADALIGDGVEELLGIADVEVVGGKAVKIDVVFGVPQEKVLTV